MKKLSIALVLLASSVGAAQAETVADALQTCGQVQNSLKRLVCYDDIVKNLNSYGGLTDLMAVPAPLPASGSAPVATRPAAPTARASAPAPQGRYVNPQDEFGLEHKQAQVQKEEDRVEKLYATITKLGKNNKNKVTVTLSNGQVWHQTHSDAMRLKVNDEVYVERGMFGAFFMSKDSTNKRMKVSRVK